MNKKVKILFTATFSTSFIREDLKLLRSHFSLTEIISSGIGVFVRILPAIKKNDITFSWFASVYSSILIFFAKIYHKKSILILGGVDVAKMPEFNYGIWNSRWKSTIVRYGIRNATVALAVDPSIKNNAIELAQYDGKNISILPTGHDIHFWQAGSEKKKNIVLTVAICNDYTRYRIKGIDFLYNVARKAPEVKFILIGMSNSIKKEYVPPENIEVFDFIPTEQLLAFYQQAKVYFQPSLREALGSTICEAMLCECYPIGTNVGGIPSVIGESGSIIPFGDVAAAVNEIRKGFETERTSKARERIIDHFSLEQREKKLLEIISSLNDN